MSTIASSPTSTDVGLSQLAHQIPARIAGRRPARWRSPPPAAPRKNGVTTDETAKTPLAARRAAVRATRPEGEGRAAQDDPERRERERHEQRRHDRGERGRKRRPEDDEIEDQPGVVRLPDRPDRVGDQCPRSGALARAARHEVPEPGPEIGAAEHGVGGHAEPQDDRRQVDGVTRAPRAVRRGPSGRSSSVPRRQPAPAAASLRAHRRRRSAVRGASRCPVRVQAHDRDERDPHAACGVTASAVRRSLYTTHGWRPTSVTIQPASRATTAAIPRSRRPAGTTARSRSRAGATEG